MTRFLHITDLHISDPETADPLRQTDTIASFAKVLDVARGLRPAPDFIVASGDMTNVGAEADYRLIARMVADYPIPIVWALGNHDDRRAFHAAFPGHPGAPDGPLAHDAVHGGVHVVALDSLVPGRVRGALDDAQLTRAEAMLNAHPDLPKLITVHHPPRLSTARLPWESLDPDSTARLAALLRGRDVIAILSGHIHMNRVTLWNGIPVIVTMGQQSTVDVTRPSGMTVLEGTGFAICDLLDTGLQTTFAPLGEFMVIKEHTDEILQSFD